MVLAFTDVVFGLFGDNLDGNLDVYGGKMDGSWLMCMNLIMFGDDRLVQIGNVVA